jgi:hypothetical protein
LLNPAPLIDQLVLHQRDLSGRTSETQKADARKRTEKLGEGRRSRSHKRSRVQPVRCTIKAATLGRERL